MELNLERNEAELILGLITSTVGLKEDVLVSKLLVAIQEDIRQERYWENRTRLLKLFIEKIKILYPKCIECEDSYKNKLHGNCFKNTKDRLILDTKEYIPPIGNVGGYYNQLKFINEPINQKTIYYMPRDTNTRSCQELESEGYYIWQHCVFKDINDAIELAQFTESKELSTIELYESKSLRGLCNIEKVRLED